MTLCAGALEGAENSAQLEVALSNLTNVLHHECDHLYHKGADFIDSYNASGSPLEAGLRHFVDLGEIRANSRALATIYVKAFPGKRFNLRLFQEYLKKNSGRYTRENAYLSYFRLLSDVNRFKASTSEGLKLIEKILSHKDEDLTPKSLKKAFQAYMNYIAYYVDYLNKHLELVDYKI